MVRVHPCPELNDNGCDGTTHQHNTHSTDSRKVHYPWHPWYGRTVWIYEIRLGRGQPVVRCGLEPTQRARSLEIPRWMLEAASCSHIHLVETPRVDGPTLQALEALLGGRVTQDRHHAVLWAGGADEDSHESTTVCPAQSSVLFSVGSDPLVPATAEHPASGRDVVGETASRVLRHGATGREGGS